MDSQSLQTPLERAVSLLKKGYMDKFCSYASFLSDETKTEALCAYCDNLLSRIILTEDIEQTTSALESVITQSYNVSPPKDLLEKFSKVKRELSQRVFAQEKQDAMRKFTTGPKGDKKRTLSETVAFLKTLRLGQCNSKEAESVWENWYEQSDFSELPRSTQDTLMRARGSSFWGRARMDLEKVIRSIEAYQKLESSLKSF